MVEGERTMRVRGGITPPLNESGPKWAGCETGRTLSVGRRKPDLDVVARLDVGRRGGWSLEMWTHGTMRTELYGTLFSLIIAFLGPCDRVETGLCTDYRVCAAKDQMSLAIEVLLSYISFH